MCGSIRNEIAITVAAVNRKIVPGEAGSALRGSSDRRLGAPGSAENGLPLATWGKVKGLDGPRPGRP